MKTVIALATWLLCYTTGCFGHAVCGEQAAYINVAQVDLLHILPPPPPPNSATDNSDVQLLLAAQQARTAAQISALRADAEFSVFRFSDVLGSAFNAEQLPIAAAFFQRVFCDENRVIEVAKTHFQRPRPFITHTNIQPATAQPANASYPSGHSTFAYVNAIVLATMLPEQAAAIFARADRYAQNRVIAGVHYPTDIEAGRIAGSVIGNALLHDEHFLADFEQARREVRHALKLE